MHVSVVGAGALGCVYGARLAKLARVDVSFVVRRARTEPLVLQRIDAPEELRLETPRWTTSIPADATVLLLCVGANDLDDALVASLRAHAAPIVTLTPLLPRDYSRLRDAFGKRLLPGMPSVASYRANSGVVRYFLPRAAQTLIEEPRPLLPDIDRLTRALNEAGIGSRMQIGTYEINAATTVTFLPLAFALDVAGSVDALFDDKELLRLALAAAREGDTLGQSLGKAASWAELLASFIGPTMLKIGVGLAKRRSPEAVHYVEQHFGAKMHAQNVVMAEEIAALAESRKVPSAALNALAGRVRAITRES
jgi:hypothetical protein